MLPFAIADGPTNMATDEVLLRSAAAGVGSLRFYGWSQPTLSLGYFQSEKLRRSDPALAAIPFVRRPSGGEMLVHHHELTYALGLPRGTEKWALRMHQIVIAALAAFGIDATFHVADASRQRHGPLCFHHFAAGDVLIGGAKVVGSSQRKHRGAVLQHGGILLAQSPLTPSLPGIRELTGRQLGAKQVAQAIRTAFETATSARLVEQSLTVAETEQVLQLIMDKYATDEWNCKR
jgi:lipoyl(octanoyl) transferase